MKKRPPRGMFLNHRDVVSLSSSSAQGLIRHLDSQLVSIKRQVCLSAPALVCLSPVSLSPHLSVSHKFVSHLCLLPRLSLTSLTVSQIQTIKQTNSALKEKLSSGIDEFRQPEVTMATQQLCLGTLLLVVAGYPLILLIFVSCYCFFTSGESEV